MRRLSIGFSIVIAVLSLGGCAVVESYTQSTPATGDGPKFDTSSTGFSYFLPKRRVKITATANAISLSRLNATLASARAVEAKREKDADAAGATLGEAKTSLAAAQFVNDEAAITAAKKTVAKATVAQKLAAAKHSFAKNKVDTLEAQIADLARAMAGNAGGDEAAICPPLNYSFRLVLLEPEPDPDQKFIASLAHMPWRDDDFSVGTTAKGLLTTSKLTTTDQTGAILVELAKIVSAVGAGAPPATGPETLNLQPMIQPKIPCPAPFVYEQAFDPTIKGDVTAVNYKLKFLTNTGANGPGAFEIDVVGKDLSDAQSIVLPTGRNPFELSMGATAPGLIYRRELPYVITVNKRVTRGSATEMIPLQAALMMLPNEGPVSVVPFTAGPFVKTVHDVTFTDGLLTKWEADKPSEFLAVVRIPIEMLKAIISVPAEIIKLRVDLSNENTKLIEAQQAQIKAAESLLKLREEIAAGATDQAVPADP